MSRSELYDAAKHLSECNGTIDLPMSVSTQQSEAAGARLIPGEGWVLFKDCPRCTEIRELLKEKL